MPTLSPRLLNAAGAALAVFAMAVVFFQQFVLGLEPCPLCVLQRLPMMTMGVVFLVAALHNPGALGLALYGGVNALLGLAGASVAGRHVWLQYLPADQVPSCGPGFDYIVETFPLSRALSLILEGSGECAQIDWQFLGLSIPEWALLGFVLLLALIGAQWPLRKRAGGGRKGVSG